MSVQAQPASSLKPLAEDVRAHVARLLASGDFRASGRPAKLLGYLIEQTLAGRGDRTKAYDLAVSVLGRDAGFDPQGDPIVRVEIGRLRRRLEHYYLTDGRAEPFRIVIPKGRYLAVWEVSGEPAAAIPAFAPDHQGSVSDLPAAVVPPRAPMPMRLRPDRRTVPAWPRLVVQPFRNVGGGELGEWLALGLTENLIAELSAFDCVEIYAELPGVSPLAGDSDLVFVLGGIVEHGLDRVRITVRLAGQRSGQIAWCGRIQRSLASMAVLDVTAEVAGAMAGRLAGPYGVIHRAALPQLAATRSPDDPWLAYASVQRAFAFRRTFARSAYPEVRADLELAVRHWPDCAAAQAMWAFALLDAARFGIVDPAARADELHVGLQAAQLAFELAPDSSLALQSLAALRYASGDVEVAERLQRRAIARTPNDPEGLAQLGWRLLARGRREECTILMPKAIGSSLVVPAWYHMVMALAAFLAGDLDDARDAAALGKHYGMGPGYATLALIEAETGHKEAARTALAEAMRRSKLLRRDPVAYWQTFQAVPEVIARFNTGLARAGL